MADDGTTKVELSKLPWLHIYSQPYEHEDARIAGNIQALKMLREELTKGFCSDTLGDLPKFGYTYPNARVGGTYAKRIPQGLVGND